MTRSLADMGRQRCILVPLDLGDAATAARSAAAELAGDLDAELVLLGVAPAPVLEPEPPEVHSLERLVGERLDSALAELPPAVRARSVQASGSIGPAVVDAVAEQGADLVVLTLRRESALEHLLDRHIQRHLLHHCPVPVLLVPPVDRGAGSRDRHAVLPTVPQRES